LKGLDTYQNGLLKSRTGTTHTSSWYFSQDGLGRQTSALNPRTYTYSKTAYHPSGTGLGRVSSTWLETSGGTVNNKRDYSYYGNNVLGAGMVSSFLEYANYATTRMAYDTRANLTHRWGDGNYPVAYEYDGLGRRVKMHTYRSGTWTGSTVAAAPFETSPDTTQWAYYSGDGFLQSKTDAAAKAVTFDYNHNGTPKTRTWARGVVTTYNYKSYATGVPSRRLANIDYPSGSGNQDVIYSTYEAGGRPKEVVDMAGKHTLTYFADGSETSDAGSY